MKKNVIVAVAFYLFFAAGVFTLFLDLDPGDIKQCVGDQKLSYDYEDNAYECVMTQIYNDCYTSEYIGGTLR